MLFLSSQRADYVPNQYDSPKHEQLSDLDSTSNNSDKADHSSLKASARRGLERRMSRMCL